MGGNFKMTTPKDDDKELESIFEIDDNKFQDTIKKAKKKITMRNILISVIVTIGVFIIFLVGWLSFMGLSQANAIQDEELYSRISSPNIYEIGYQIDNNGLIEGTLSFARYKMVGDIPIDWYDDIINYNLFGYSSKRLGDYSYVQTTDKIDGLPRYYDRDVKERIIQFYHPNVGYKKIRNDIDQLKNIDSNKEIEIAISFDKGYSPKDVRELLPKDVSLKWYWLDTYTENDERLKDHIFKEKDGKIVNLGSDPIIPDHIYGFNETNEGGLSSEETFLRDLKDGINIIGKKDYAEEFKLINDNLRGDSKQPKVSDLKIIGVIVTGSPSQLESLKNLKQVRASVFGAIVEKDY
jgi:hypothetical protein